jgi:hypothetical protein
MLKKMDVKEMAKAGGLARAKKLSGEKRREIAVKAGLANGFRHKYGRKPKRWELSRLVELHRNEQLTRLNYDEHVRLSQRTPEEIERDNARREHEERRLFALLSRKR